MIENLQEQMVNIEEFRFQNAEKPLKYSLNDSVSFERKKSFSNLKTKKKSNKPEFGLYHPNTGIPVFFSGPEFYQEYEEDFRINLSRVFCRRQDYIKSKLES